MHEVDVIERREVAAAALEPIRLRLLGEMAAPASAAELGERLGLPRQKVNYHLRTLEGLGLAEVAETRAWGGLTERRMIASAGAYVISPGALGAIGPDPARVRDPLAAGYLVALAARVVREVGQLLRAAKGAPATLSIDTEIRFRSPAERAAFTRELTQAVAALASRYHDPSAEGGRPHRLVVAAHPIPET